MYHSPVEIPKGALGKTTKRKTPHCSNTKYIEFTGDKNEITVDVTYFEANADNKLISKSITRSRSKSIKT